MTVFVLFFSLFCFFSFVLSFFFYCSALFNLLLCPFFCVLPFSSVWFCPFLLFGFALFFFLVLPFSFCCSTFFFFLLFCTLFFVVLHSSFFFCVLHLFFFVLHFFFVLLTQSKRVHVTRNTFRHTTTNNTQLTRTSWRFVPDAILPGHRRALWWTRAGHPRYTSAHAAGRPWVARHNVYTHNMLAEHDTTHCRRVGHFYSQKTSCQTVRLSII